MDVAAIALFEEIRGELHGYLCRLVVRPAIAEELVQTTFLRGLEASERLPDQAEGLRAWFFKVATNLAIDELRRHATWRENMMLDLREAAEADPDFISRSLAMAGTPETKAIAREHLAACFSCTLRNLPEKKAAALLLKDVHGFSLDELAGLLEAGEGQVKNWLQEARAYMTAKYRQTCALIEKDGVCHQCVELDGFFRAGQGSPLSGNEPTRARLQVLQDLRSQQWGPWHRMMFDLMDKLD